MTKITAQLSISLDGYAAGPDQSEQDPLGVGGEQLHEWAFGNVEPNPVDQAVAQRTREGGGAGAYVMGRNMFGPIRGEWTGDWRGWWGDEPPYHAPVFVLTHHPRESLEMAGGTTFHFVTEGLDAAVERARAAAGERPVHIAGGAATVRQALAAAIVDEIELHHAPLVLGAGEGVFDRLDGLRLKPIEALHSPVATHVRYSVVRADR